MTVRTIMPWRADGPYDITLLETAGRAAKLINPDGSVDPHETCLWHRPHAVRIEGFDDLVELVGWLLDQPHLFVVRGALRRPTNGEVPRRHVDRRTDDGGVIEAPFAPCARAVLALDMDGGACPRGYDIRAPEHVAAAARRLLPAPLQLARCVATRTGSALIKPGLRVRLWVLLHRPITDQEAKRLLRGTPGVDLSLYSATQPHLTAAPVVAEGAVDPCPDRMAVLVGCECAEVPPLPEPQPRGEAPITAANPYVPPNRGLGFRATRAERYMLACVRAVAEAPRGQGRDTLKGVSRRLFGLAKVGLLDPHDVAARLKGAMLARGGSADETACGETLQDVSRLLAWCWDHAEPRGLS